jgi:Domain of unknown function (DUF4296)
MTRAGLTYFILLNSIAWSCREEKLPSGVLSKAEYAAFLVEVHLALSRDSASGLFFNFEERLLQKKGLADSVVKATYQYYLNHPRDLEEVYVAVVDTLSLREQRYKGKY